MLVVQTEPGAELTHAILLEPRRRLGRTRLLARADARGRVRAARRATVRTALRLLGVGWLLHLKMFARRRSTGSSASSTRCSSRRSPSSCSTRTRCAVRLARRRGHGHLVRDEHRRRLGDAARAAARDARAARRRARALRARAPADHDRARDDRRLLDGRDAPVGSDPVRDRAHDRAAARLRRSRSRSRVITIGMLGFLLAVSFVRYRPRWALGNLFEYPVWLICGFLVPISLLPRLGAPDLVGARADVGDARDARVGARRDPVARPRRWRSRSAASTSRSRLLVLERMLDAARARAVLSLT